MMEGTAENGTTGTVDGPGTNTQNSPPVEALARPEVIRSYGVTNRFLVKLEPKPRRNRQQAPEAERKSEENDFAKVDPQPHSSRQEPHEEDFDFEMFTSTSSIHAEESHTQKRPEPIRKKHRCSQCPYSAHKKSNLNRHELTHLNKINSPVKNPTQKGNPNIKQKKKPLGCPRCSYKCRDQSSLSKHELCHIGEVRYDCDVCNYSTRWKHNLDRHRRQVHVDSNKPFQCKWCQAGFSNKYGLAVHNRIHSLEKSGDSNK